MKIMNYLSEAVTVSDNCDGSLLAAESHGAGVAVSGGVHIHLQIGSIIRAL